MADSAMARLGSIAENRWGLITTAQAQKAGVSRKQLSRMASAGAIERVAQGVYRMAGARAWTIRLRVIPGRTNYCSVAVQRTSDRSLARRVSALSAPLAIGDSHYPCYDSLSGGRPTCSIASGALPRLRVVRADAYGRPGRGRGATLPAHSSSSTNGQIAYCREQPAKIVIAT
jgi:hypothetical protein